MTVTPEERQARTELVDTQILLDAIELNPCRLDLGWDRFRMAVLRARIRQLHQAVAVIRLLAPPT